MNSNSKLLLRPPEAGKYLGLSPSTLAKQRLRGDGSKFVRLSPRAIGYLQADLDEWVASRLPLHLRIRPADLSTPDRVVARNSTLNN